MTHIEDLRIERAHETDADDIVGVIHAAFGARASVSPPPPALAETSATIAAEIAEGSGVVARVAGRIVGVILVVTDDDRRASLRRVSVHPDFQKAGVASAMVPAADQIAASMGCRAGALVVRREFPGLLAWWQRCGYHVVRTDDLLYHLERKLPVIVRVPDADAMRGLGRRLAAIVRSGDLIMLEGELGAGKTTFAQGFGAGLGITAPITSPTFVLSHVHAAPDGPDLVHVDAYRLADADELDDLDLASSATEQVFLIEWGEGKAEHLAQDRLWVVIDRSSQSDERIVVLDGHGDRWAIDLEEALGLTPPNGYGLHEFPSGAIVEQHQKAPGENTPGQNIPGENTPSQEEG